MHNLTPEILKYIDQSVLCWLATTSPDLQPTVSPKEIFTHYGEDKIIIANIASPQSARNIRLNNKVCVSFIDILVQKGYQLYGTAQIIDPTSPDYPEKEQRLTAMTGGIFPFTTIFVITISRARPIIAPRYTLFPATQEEAQIASARKAYGF